MTSKPKNMVTIRAVAVRNPLVPVWKNGSQLDVEKLPLVKNSRE
ncbi:MAG: hypothetical protein A4E30_01166 [Methanomassiliicoccales archaeon PtaB.Bin215]|nr:MAG: hypothetical protein A4E30_01166 [Methanomassiliicoccales archaeon PtaB.Bin215]